MTSDRCRLCGQLAVDAHMSWCELSGVEPLPEDPPLDETRADRAEDDYADQMIGSYRMDWPDRDY